MSAYIDKLTDTCIGKTEVNRHYDFSFLHKLVFSHFSVNDTNESDSV